METNAAIADQNTGRLIQAGYQPEPAPAEFAASLAMKMTETAKVLAQKQPLALPKPGMPWRRIAVVIGGMAACLLVIFALSALFRQRPRESKGSPLPSDDAQLPERATKPTDAPQPIVQLAKWTDDVRDGMMPRIRPAAPALPILKDGQKLSTKAGERRLVQLADGSRLYVNEKTEVEANSARQLKLDSGQIYLEVAAGWEGEAPAEPAPRENGSAGASPSRLKSASKFVVKTAHREMTATGTHFAVQADAVAAGLVVTQGKVAVKGIDKEVAAGQQIAAGESAISSAPRATHTLAWTRDLMAAAETPMVPACQHAGGELIALDPQGQEIKLSLRQFHIDVHIEDGFARTTIDQTYFNTTWERLEGTFYFPLPADASLSRLAMYVADGNQCKLMEGGMAERKHAADVYETIRYMRRDPALLEWLDGSTFKMRVFPLEAKQEKRIILSYTQKLPSLYGNTRYRFAGGLNMPAVREWSFNARIKSGAGMTVWSPTVPDLQIIPQGGDTLVRHFANNVKPAADVTIEMQDKTAVAENDAPRFAAMLADNQQYLMLRYRPTLPSLPERQRRDWIVLFEASAGRDPVLAGTQVDVLRNLLKNAEYDDTFTLLTVNSKVQIYDGEPSRVSGQLPRGNAETDPLRGSARQATPQNVDGAIKFLQSTHLIGALDLEQGLQTALKFAKDAKNPHILHIGSGIPAMGQRDAGKLAQMLPERVRYVGVGVGKRWNRAFMKAAAERTNGLFTQINPDEVIAWRAFELLATLNTPRLLDVQVLNTASGEARFLSETTMIAQGEEICAITRVPTNKGVVPGKVVLKGTLAGKPFVKEIPVGNVLSGAGYLPRIWAKLEIDRLLAADSAKHKDEIISLSKAMYVMSPFTSLLVLETDADYERFKVDRGRKDHWAMHQCPPKIPLVYEPEGKAPVKEQKPEARKGSKPKAGEVLATMAPSEANGAKVIPLLNNVASDVAVLLNQAFGGNALIVPHVRTNSIIVHAKPIDLLTIKRLVANRLDFPPNSATFRDFVSARTSSTATAGPVGGYADIVVRIKEARTGSLMLSAGVNSDNGLVGSLTHPRYDDGGIYAGLEGVLYSTDRPLASQVAERGFLDLDGSIAGPPGTFVGSKQATMAGTSVIAGVPNLPGTDGTAWGQGIVKAFANGSVANVSFLVKNAKMPDTDGDILRDVRRSAVTFEDLKIAEANLAGLDLFAFDPERKSRKAADDRAETVQLMNSLLKQKRELFDRGAHANDEMFVDLLKHNSIPQVVTSVLVSEAKLIGNEAFGTELGLQVPMQFARTANPAAQTSLRYERPQFAYDRTLFTDLLQYAPGLHTAYADVLATLEEEADVAAPTLGSIDSAARKLIEKARSSDWQTLAIPAQGPIPGYPIHFNGNGQFTYERILGSGLGEKVICDGKTLVHVYPEIGLASKRAFSRHHHDLAAAINPAFLPAAEELARGCDVKAIDDVTVAITSSPRPGTPGRGAGGEGPSISTHLVFAKDGRLSERRIVEMPAGKTLVKQIFQADGAIEWRRSDDKILAKQPRSIAPAKTPSLTPDLSDLVVLNLPIRTPEYIIAQAKKRNIDADLGERFIAGCFMGEPLDKEHTLAHLFATPANRKLGYYVLLNAVGVNHVSVNAVGENVIGRIGGKKWLPANPEVEHPKNALAIFLSQAEREVRSNDQTPLGALPGPKDGFIQKLGRFRDLWLTWHQQRPNQNPADMPTHKAKVMEFLQDTPSPLFAYAILDTMQRRCNIAPSDRMLEITVKRFGPVTSPVGLGYVGRYEYARSLYHAGLSGEAGKQFRDLYADTLKLGMLPPIDADFRAAVQVGQPFQADAPGSQAGKPDLRFVGFIRKSADRLIEKKRFGLAFQLAAQMDQLGDAALCDEVLTAILARASDKERNAVTLVCVQFQAQRKNFAQADRLLAKLLADKELAQHSELWRGRSHIAKQLGQTAESVRCLEKALDLEFAELPEVVNLESIRADYRLILEQYQRIAEASASLEKSAPQAFLAKVIRTADRWRLVNPEAAEPCKLAGKILATCGARDLAWDYWTTPIDLHPAESRPWVELAETLQAEGDLERTDRAFALGFEAEPTNPELLWKRAQNLARLGQPEQARTLYRQIADGSWQERFNATVEQARGLAGK